MTNNADEVLAAIVENIPNMVFVKDAKTLRFVLFNRAGEELLGLPRDEMLGKSDADFFPAEQAEFFNAKDREVLAQGALVDVPDEPIQTAGKGTRILHTKKVPIMGPDGQPQYLLGISEDVTELHHARKLEEQLRQAQKLEAVARLAGGVAHDFNNLLTVILAEIELLKLSGAASSNPSLADALGEIEDAARRAAMVTRQLLTFSRRDVVSLQVLDPIEVVEGLTRLLGRLIGEDIDLEVLHGSEAGEVRIDRGQLEQVIVNLVVNSRDAMPRGGRVQIEVRDVVLDESYAETHADCTPGSYVLISVSDGGIGMNDETRQRLFEPFFTTKAIGRGTGLGLATSYGIVRDAGGHIGVYSEVGVGTTMKVYLPRTSDEAQDTAEDPAAGTEREPLEATVLVVEDDAAVRRSVVRALEGFGCSVISAANATEALALIDRGDHTIDLIFTDVVMPGRSGPELVEKARERLPNVSVLFTTGYTSDMALRLRLIDDAVDVLAKPYTPADLETKVRGALGR